MEQLWQISPAFGDVWNSDIFTKESETLTKALQKTFASQYSYEEEVSTLLPLPDLTPVTTPAVSGGSENELPHPKKRRSIAPSPSGRATKKKSRASKRATITFITANPSNFRQMVQQVTGASFGDLSVMKLEPHRLQPVGIQLTALDSSTFFLDGSAGYLVPPPAAPLAGGGLEFDSFCGYPTLESWRVV